MTWCSIYGLRFFLSLNRYLQCGLAGKSGLRLHEDDKIAAFELFIADPDQCRFGFLSIRIVLAQDASSGTLISPLPNQRPAFEQILLQMQVIVARWMLTLRWNLHVDTHRESPFGDQVL
jgi:hypothetical protein